MQTKPQTIVTEFLAICTSKTFFNFFSI